MNQIVCQECKKSVATVHLMEISGREKRERHLCERCAVEEAPQAQKHVPLNELLTNFVLQQSGAAQLAQLECPECGMTFAEFRNTGVLGCPHDYDTLDKALVPLIQRAHEGAKHHVGKAPRGANPQAGKQTREQSRLRRELDAAVTNEDFERAARLRDELRKLDRSEN